MLVISRRPGQAVLIGEDIEIEVIESSAGKVKLGISAPREVRILRNEILLTRRENLIAACAVPQETVRHLIEKIRPKQDAGLPDGKILPELDA